MQLPFRAIGVFHAVARTGSISRAADELHVTPSAVSQQIQSLEAQLGTALTLKVGRNVALTEAGERFYQMIGREVDRIAEATDWVRGFRSVTTLVVRAAPSLSTKWLLPLLHDFVSAHPNIEVRLDGTTEPTAFGRENVDIEIRHGRGDWPGLYVEALAEEYFFPLCAPQVAKSASLAPCELLSHRLIHSVKSQMQWLQWFAAAQVEPAERWRRVLFDRTHMAIDYAAEGGGIALESNLMAWRELANGTLVCPVSNPPLLPITTQWIVCPHDHLRRGKNLAFLDWVRGQRVAWAETCFKGGTH
jgi:LysR family transcriptional regulator, glycine cleavage system transcriptional activator